MHAEFQFSDSDVSYAESKLLPKNATFDEERRRFITCLDTMDLQAVPGSGKTTALLAKLLIFERHLPMSGGQGVLVISHTNAAVNEIRDSIGGICPKIFSYPNYIGTIQSFVDSFLAIPSFVQVLGFRPSRIDADSYNSEISRRISNLHHGARSWIDRRAAGDPEGLVQNLRFDSELNLTNGLGGPVLLKRENGSGTYKALCRLKHSVFKSGILHFEDVFWFASRLLDSDSQVKRLLQRRFRFVFVDEMQDMAPHHHCILEGVFGPDSGASTVFQRIGDSDQAIFEGSNVTGTQGWKPRDVTLTLSNSLRLSPPIAKILAPFASTQKGGFEIRGLQDSEILPHLLIYNDDSIDQVIKQYADLIEKFQVDGRIPSTCPNKFMAVAWNSDRKGVPDPGKAKLRLIDFCPCFQRSILRKQQEFETLADFISGIDHEDRTLCSARKSLLKAICRALELSNVVDSRSERPYTPRSFISYFRFETTDKTYSRINRIILKLSIKLVERKEEVVLRALRGIIPKLINHFGCTHTASDSFLSGETTVQDKSYSYKGNDANSLNFGDITIGLGTVHSVKGQTHTATLYIESAYYNDGGKKYESQRLAAQFLGKRIRSNAGKRVIISAKMVYVGFSRPTHLLVCAVHRDNFDSYLSGIDTTLWKIVQVKT